MSLQVKNVRYYYDIPFEDYLALPGYSFSGLKGAKIGPTPKMQLGTKVHSYLLTPAEYQHDEPLVPPLAMALKGTIGPLLKYCTPELAVTADFEYEGLRLPYKGRIDLPIIGRLVIDIKVTELDLRRGIDHFSYHHQVSGYSLAIGAPHAVIVSVNRKTKNTQVVPVRVEAGFWERACLKYGKPINSLTKNSYS